MQSKTVTSVAVVGFLAMAFAASWIGTVRDAPNGTDKTTDHGTSVEYLGSAGVIFQTRSNNCGTAALMMVLDHYGMKASQREMEQRARLEFRGASLLTLRELAKSAGLDAKGWRLSAEDLPRIRFPAILYVENHHFIVVDSVDGKGFLFVRDPAVGRLKIPHKKAIDIWKGETLVIAHESR